jgi:hypothetical protein
MIVMTLLLWNRYIEMCKNRVQQKKRARFTRELKVEQTQTKQASEAVREVATFLCLGQCRTWS